jgi:hypothetical protein
MSDGLLPQVPIHPDGLNLVCQVGGGKDPKRGLG